MTEWTSVEPAVVPAPTALGRNEMDATTVDPRAGRNDRLNPSATMTQSLISAPGRQRIDVPRQRLPTNYAVISHHQDTVLLADPGGAIDEALRPALLQFADCRIVHAGTVSDVIELVDSGLVGDLAMVSLQFRPIRQLSSGSCGRPAGRVSWH